MVTSGNATTDLWSGKPLQKCHVIRYAREEESNRKMLQDVGQSIERNKLKSSFGLTLNDVKQDDD